MKKFYITILILLAIITLLGNVSMAKEVVINGGTISENDEIVTSEKQIMGEKGVEFVQTRSNLSFTPDSKTNSMASTIFGVAQYICLGAIFIILVIKGVQFMAAAPEGKAEIKKQIIAIAIGAFIVFSIRAILVIISNLNLF